MGLAKRRVLNGRDGYLPAWIGAVHPHHAMTASKGLLMVHSRNGGACKRPCRSLFAKAYGDVAVGQPYRGLGFVFFTMLFVMLTWHTTTPEQSFIGRTTGGLLVRAMPIPDAYRIAGIRCEAWKGRNPADA
jgi:hypothetical protein